MKRPSTELPLSRVFRPHLAGRRGANSIGELSVFYPVGRREVGERRRAEASTAFPQVDWCSSRRRLFSPAKPKFAQRRFAGCQGSVDPEA